MRAPFQAINKRFSLPLLPLAEWLFLPWFIFYRPTRSRFSRWLGNPNGNRHCLCTRYHGVIKQTSATPIKNLLLALAIIDDLGAIVVIALFFSHGLSVQALVFAAIAIAVLIALNRFKVTALCAYMLVGTILWASVLKSGVHATLAGVIIGFCIPLKGKMAKPRYMTLNIFLPLGHPLLSCHYSLLPMRGKF